MVMWRHTSPLYFAALLMSFNWFDEYAQDFSQSEKENYYFEWIIIQFSIYWNSGSSVFCVLWLATQTWDIQCDSPTDEAELA